MSLPVLPPYEAPFKPVPQVTPFTYRDGVTMLKKLENLQKYINRVLVPFVNDNYEQLADDFEEQVNILIAAVNAAIDTIINSSIEIQDPIVATMINDEESATRIALDALFATIADLDVTNAAVVDIQNVLAGRLSDIALEAKFITQVQATQKYGRVLRPEMYGAVGDGVTDDSAAFQAIISALQDGDRVVGDSSKVYAVFTPIHIADVNNIHWEGGNYKFTRNTASSNGSTIAFRTENVNDSLFENFFIEQFNQTPQYTGISINNSNNTTIRNVHAHNFRWVGIAVGAGGLNTEIVNCIATQCRFGGFSTIDGTKFIGGRFSSEWSQTQEFITKGGVWDTTSLYYDGIIIGGNNWAIVGVTLDDNGQSGVYSALATHGIIQSCIVKDNWNKGIDLGVQNDTDNILHMSILGNTLAGNKTGEISFVGVGVSSVIGNTISVTSETFAIGLHQRCDSNVINGNMILSTAVSTPAMFIDSSGPDSASSNVITDNVIGALVPDSVNTASNVLSFGSNGVNINRSAISIDRSELTGFDGRHMLSFTGSDAENHVTILVNKPLMVAYADGTPVIAEFSGIFAFDNAIPPATRAGGGTIYTEAGALKYKGATGTVTTLAPA